MPTIVSDSPALPVLISITAQPCTHLFPQEATPVTTPFRAGPPVTQPIACRPPSRRHRHPLSCPGCRFPGCGRTRWTHAHHRRHWADGGPTDLDNLVQLCSAHHHLIHSDNWRIEGDADGPLRFVRPDGRPLADHPPPLGRRARDHLNGRFPPDLGLSG